MGNWMKFFAGLALMGGFAFLWYLVATRGLFSQETAAWVQALGSVAAIFAAGYFASLPLRHAEEARRRARLALIEAVDEAVKAYWGPVSQATRSVKQRNHLLLVRAAQERDGATDRALRGLLQMPAASWPSARLYVAAAQLVSHGDALMASIAGLGAAQLHADVFDALIQPAFHAVKARIDVRRQIAADRQVY